MFIYVSFPVGMFLVFNWPGFYEDAILQARREQLLPKNFDREGCESFKQMVKERKREKMEKDIEAIKARQSSG